MCKARAIASKSRENKLQKIKKSVFNVNANFERFHIRIKGSRAVNGKRFLESNASSFLGTLT